MPEAPTPSAIDPGLVERLANEIYREDAAPPAGEPPQGDAGRPEPESAVPKADPIRGAGGSSSEAPTPPVPTAAAPESGGAAADPDFYFLPPAPAETEEARPAPVGPGAIRSSDASLGADGMRSLLGPVGGQGPLTTPVPTGPQEAPTAQPPAPDPTRPNVSRETPTDGPMPSPPRGRPDLPMSGDPFTAMATRLLEGFPGVASPASGGKPSAPRFPSSHDDLATILSTLPGSVHANPGAQPARARDASPATPRETPAERKPAARTSASEVPAVGGGEGSLDPHVLRKDFPALQQNVHGKPLIWMDNAATTQKPRQVIERLSRFYEKDYSNIHRGAHTLAARATEAYENAREKVRRFLGAASAEEIVFVRGTTEAINLVAQTYGKKNLGPGDEVLLTEIEHHANIVPWQMIARERGAKIRVVPISERGEVLMEEYARLLGPRTKVVGVTQVSNALGTVVPVQEMIALAHRRNVPVLVDGAQSVPHMRIDLQELGADFFVFSGHKLYGPSGVGALYARRDLQQDMPPWQGGGNMIRAVTFDHTTYSDPPAKFEAGTPTIADAVGLGAAIEYVERVGIENVSRYEHALTEYGMERLAEVPGIRLIGTSPGKVSVLSFVFPGTRPEDVGRYLDGHGIAVRAGHHCAMPTMQRYGITGTVRPSIAFYNTREEVDCLVEALKAYPDHRL